MRTVVALFLVFVACGPMDTVDGGTMDAGRTDSNTTDAGQGDAGVIDGGPRDAGPIDAGTPDAGGTREDAGTPDAGGTGEDAGTTDAGTTDGGTIDAGTLDAGLRDAGTSDAGTTDAGTSDAGSTDAGRDAGMSDAGSANLLVEVSRVGSTSQADLAIRLSSPGLIELFVSGTGNSGSLMQSSATAYSVRITPTSTSGAIDVLLRATIGTRQLVWRRTLLVLPFVEASWNQPEAVPGLVNTDGYEDGAEASPDGEWLVVTDYSPMDVVGCGFLNGGRRPSNPLCTTALGPIGAPERPGMPGASRTSPFRNQCPRLCFTSNGLADGGDLDPTFAESNGIVLPPVSAWIFRRQPDSTFTEPTALVYEADGCAHLMGVSFVSLSSGAASVVFAYDGDQVSPLHRVQSASINLGQRNVLGTYSCTSTWSASASGRTAVDLTPPGSLGNPNVGGGFLWYDDEAGDGALRFRSLTGALPDASVSLEAEVAPRDAGPRYMPLFHGSSRRLFYSRSNQAIESRALTGSTPVNPGSWGPAVEHLVADTATSVGRIFSIGEPSVAERPDGGRELYFVYATKTDAGVNMNIGRVPSR